MRISTTTVKSIMILLAFTLSSAAVAQASNPTVKPETAEEEEAQNTRQPKGEKAPEAEVYKPDALGDIDLKKYKANETKLSRPEKIKPVVEKPAITLPKADF